MPSVALAITSEGQGIVETGEVGPPLGESGKDKLQEEETQLQKCLWRSRTMRTERDCPLDLATWQPLVAKRRMESPKG